MNSGPLLLTAEPPLQSPRAHNLKRVHLGVLSMAAIDCGYRQCAKNMELISSSNPHDMSRKTDTVTISTARSRSAGGGSFLYRLGLESLLCSPELAASCGEGANTPAVDTPTPGHLRLVTFSVPISRHHFWGFCCANTCFDDSWGFPPTTLPFSLKTFA